MFKFIRKLFARSKTDDGTEKVPYLREPAYMTQVEDDLDRHFGMKIERRNTHIPELRGDQFARDVGATRNARRVNPRRIKTNTDSLQ